MSDRDPLLNVANSSGFPLQIAVEHLVHETSNVHGWTVCYVEHAWVNRADNHNGFIDIVLQDRNRTSILVVECKRVRDSTWLFLRSDGTNKERLHCKSWVSRYAEGRMKYFGWHDLVANPPSTEAVFCAVRGQSANEPKPMIERVASELVSSTEALAWEEKDFRPDLQDNIRFYFNVIVTTAELKVGRFSPDQISLADGALKAAEFSQVPFVRFRKQLSLRSDPLTPEDFGGGNPSRAKENTVFVVNAESLTTFLSSFEIQNDSANQFIQG